MPLTPLFLIFLRVKLVDAWALGLWISAVGDVHKFQEPIHACIQSLGRGALGLFAWDTVEDYDLVCKIGCHHKVMLYNEGTPVLYLHPLLDYGGDADSLLSV